MFGFSLDYSIFSCFKNKWDQVKRPENVWECVRDGVQATVSSWVTVTTALVAAAGLALAVNSYNPSVLKTDDQSYDLGVTTTLFHRVIEAPLKEELAFRLINQNVIYCIQESMKEIFPSKNQKNRFFEWLTSPGFRALSSGAIFARAHLANAGGYLSSAVGAAQVLLILTMPVGSIVFEKTRPKWKGTENLAELAKHVFFPFIASSASHIANNLMAEAPLESLIGCLFLTAVQKKFAASPVSKEIPPNSIKEIPEGCRFS